jgi:hypothetical protein
MRDRRPLRLNLLLLNNKDAAGITGVLLFRHWHDLAAKKRKETHEQTAITNVMS